MNRRKRYDRKYQARVVLESLANVKTIAELAGEFDVHPNQIARWRLWVLETMFSFFFEADEGKALTIFGEAYSLTVAERTERHHLRPIRPGDRI